MEKLETDKFKLTIRDETSKLWFTEIHYKSNIDNVKAVLYFKDMIQKYNDAVSEFDSLHKLIRVERLYNVFHRNIKKTLSKRYNTLFYLKKSRQ